MKRIVGRFALSLIVGVAVLLPSLMARADGLGCGAGGHSFSGEVNYSFDGTYVNWDNAGGSVSDTGRGSNNINFFLVVDGYLIWDAYSPDSLSDGEWYSAGIGIGVPATEYQEFYVQAIFDERFSGDPDCWDGIRNF
jgi:hypothetical protein